MSEQYRCNECGHTVIVPDDAICEMCNIGIMEHLRYIKGGGGSHWEGCEEVHWDCKIAQLEKEIARRDEEVAELRKQKYIPVHDTLTDAGKEYYEKCIRQEKELARRDEELKTTDGLLKEATETIGAVIACCTYNSNDDAKIGIYGIDQKAFTMIDQFITHYNDAVSAGKVSVDVKVVRKEFCPNCEAEVPCTHEAELYVCDICGEDFAKYIVSRNCNVSDVSMTQDVSTDIKTPQSVENNNPVYNNQDYYKQEIARLNEIIARLKEDAERLATRAVYWDEYSNEYECIHLECGAHSENILLEHSKTCPITLHRALMKELGER